MIKTIPILLMLAFTRSALAQPAEAPARVSSTRTAGIPIIIDTDLGEDIDDIFVLSFALISPEIDLLGITTVDGDVDARSRIARLVTRTVGRPRIPVAAGYRRRLPGDNSPWQGRGGVTQGELAPDEAGLPPGDARSADRLMADCAERYPGQLTIVTLGSLTNVGQFLVRYPESARKLKAIVTNGGNFEGPDSSIGWNLRYDPVSAALIQASGVPWVLLSESACRFAGFEQSHVDRFEAAEAPLARLLSEATRLWHKNKPDASPLPHLSDLNALIYLMRPELLPVEAGGVFLELGPSTDLPGFSVRRDRQGGVLLGATIARGPAHAMREFVLERLLEFRHPLPSD